MEKVFSLTLGTGTVYLVPVLQGYFFSNCYAVTLYLGVKLFNEMNVLTIVAAFQMFILNV